MKWNEMFKEGNRLNDNAYIALQGATRHTVLGNGPLDEEAELTKKQEEGLIDFLQDTSGWTSKLLERCGCRPAGKVVVEVRGGIAEVASKPDDIVVEIMDYDNKDE